MTDLGIARVWRPDNMNDTSGTPGYMGISTLLLCAFIYVLFQFKAPEVMCRQNHGVAADYYAVGVIGYEFMLGRVGSNQRSSFNL